MSQKVYVRQGKIGSVMGIIVGCLMLIFGVVFFGLVREDNSVIGQIFIPIWMLVLIVIIAFNVYNLVSKKASSVAMAELELDSPAQSGTVEEKLRGLERLKKERLITEEEYKQKRKEIMEQKW